MSKRKKLLSILVVAVLLIASMVPAFAEAPKFWDLKTGKEYNTASEVVAAIRVGEVVGENIYEKIGDEGYVNVVERFNTKIEALRQFLNEKSIGSPEELLEDTELFESFINVGKEAAETVPAKSKEEIAAGEGKSVVKSVDDIDDIEVKIGGTYELPKTVKITLSDDTVIEVPVEWEDTVDVEEAGTYELEGTLDLSELENVAATNKVAKVNVVVAEKIGLAVEAVSAITTMVDTNDITAGDAVVEFAINEETEAPNAETMAKLEELGYTFEFLATAAVFNDGATVPAQATSNDTGAILGPVTADFKYKVVVSLEDEVVAESALVEVEVVNYSTIAVDAEITVPAYVDASDTSKSLVVASIEAKDGSAITTGEDVEYEALTPSIATINLSTGAITPIQAGTAKFLVKIDGASDGEFELEKEVTVSIVDEVAVPTTVTADPASVKITNAAGVSKDVVLTVEDQYGELVSGETIIVEVGDNTLYDLGTITGSNLNVTDNGDGTYTFTVQAASTSTVDTDTLTVKIGTDEFTTVAVEFVDGEVATMVLEEDTNNVNEVYANVPGTVTVNYNGYAADGSYAGGQDLTAGTLSVEIENPDGSAGSNTGTPANGEITFAVAEAGDYTVTVKEGAIVLDTITVTVVDVAPAITGVTVLETGIDTAGTYALTDLVKINLSEALGDYDDDGTTDELLLVDSGSSDGKGTIEVDFDGDASGDAVIGTYELVINPSNFNVDVTTDSTSVDATGLGSGDTGSVFVKVFTGTGITPDFVVEITFDVE